MKAKLLNNGFFQGMENIEFPIIVNCNIHWTKKLCGVTGSDLINAGAREFDSNGTTCFDKNRLYHFEIGAECEVIEE